jgi:hypothetical protein
MTEIPDASQFVGASRAERAVMLLQASFREEETSVARIDVARAIANEIDSGSRGMIGGAPMSTSNPLDHKTALLVSEAWQVLERAGLICPDLLQSTGNWWVITPSGRAVRDGGDPLAELELRLQGR